MVAETMESYRGVSCICCRQPIAVSAKVADIRDKVESDDTHAPRTFIARCKLCDCENVYSISDVQSFSGAPRQRKLKARAARAAA